VQEHMICGSKKFAKTGEHRDSECRTCANLSLIVTSCKPLPSAASRLSSGTVKPLGFFQFDTGGGIFHASWSSAVNFRDGDRSIGGGGLGGPYRSILAK
jgi:hypothetical protein